LRKQTLNINELAGMGAAFTEILIKFPEEKTERPDSIDVEMPIGIFTNYAANPPCGLCSTDSITGYLDSPDSFLNPGRLKAGLLWMGGGFVEYKFPNNAKYENRKPQKLELSLELSSETLDYYRGGEFCGRGSNLRRKP
jgi:predicted transcriptional regulator